MDKLKTEKTLRDNAIGTSNDDLVDVMSQEGTILLKAVHENDLKRIEHPYHLRY